MPCHSCAISCVPAWLFSLHLPTATLHSPFVCPTAYQPRKITAWTQAAHLVGRLKSIHYTFITLPCCSCWCGCTSGMDGDRANNIVAGRGGTGLHGACCQQEKLSADKHYFCSVTSFYDSHQTCLSISCGHRPQQT